MSTELDKARAALERFTAESREIVAGRFRGTRKSAPMNRMLPGAVGYLASALAEVDRLTAAMAEAEATIANERGEGEAPVPGWRWIGTCWENATERWEVIRENCEWVASWDGESMFDRPTARAAMRAAAGVKS